MAARSPGAATVGALGICATLMAIVLWPSGSPSVHAQELSVPGCTVEAEPNDTLDAAQMVRVADCPDGGIVIHGDIEGFELDLYRFEVPDGPPTLRDVTVLPTDAAPHGLCLRSEIGDHRQCRQGSDGTALPDLLLTPGDHVIEIKGGSDASFDYELQVRPAGPWTPALEAEPNDHIYVASPFELARGVTGDSRGGDEDNLAATVSGPSQLWEVSVTGQGLERVYWQGERGTLAQAAIDPGGERAVMTDLLLVPGTHTFLVRTNGEYAVRATSLGTPAEGTEREPNDDDIHAETYRIGERRVGRLPESTDVDRFRFTAAAPEHLVLTLDQPLDADIEVRLTTGGLELLRKGARQPGEPLELDLWLPPGDHDLMLYPIQPSAESYELTIVRGDPFASAYDREPNDVLELASSVPPTLRWTGAARGSGDVDWYALPTLSSPASVSLSVEPPQTRLALLIGGTVATPEDGGDGELIWNDVPANAPLRMSVTGDGEYAVSGRSDGWAPVPARSEPTLDLSFAMDTDTVAAYWPESQLVDGSLTLTNTGTDVLDLAIETITSHDGWTAIPGDIELELAPGTPQEIAVALEVAPDAWAGEPVRVSVAARTPDGGLRSAAVSMEAHPVAEPVRPHAAFLVPDALLGGLNVANLALGATPAEVAGAERVEALHDGVTPISLSFSAPWDGQPLDLVVDLAGDGPVPIAGMILHPLGLDRLLSEIPRDVELLLSTDGTSWESAIRSELTPFPRDQAFVIGESVPATHAMLRIHSLNGYGRHRVTLGEWKVVAEPGATPDPMPRDIAEPVRGGHVVSYVPFVLDLGTGYRMLDADRTPELASFQDPGSGFHAVIGFNEGRAAQVERLIWHDAEASDPSLRLDRVDVAISLDGPLGPWQQHGEWSLARDATGSVAPYAFDAPTWTRYVRLSGPLPDDAVQMEFPADIEVIERDTDQTYRSILGEWGYTSKLGPYEWSGLAPAPVASDRPDPGDTPDDADPLGLGEGVAQRVAIDTDVDWYRVEVPDGDNTLELDVTGVPTIAVRVSVVDEAGDALPTSRTPLSGGVSRYQAIVEGGRSYLVLIEQPPASIAIAYDTSESMGPFYDLVLAGMREYAADVEPGREAVLADPFGYPPLLEDFIDDPYALQAAVTDASLQNSLLDGTGTSDAEVALIEAAGTLADRDGRRAILIVTDAESPTENLTPQLWAAFDEVRPIVHAIHVSNVGSPRETRDRMRAWAHSSGGHYENATTLAEMTRAFERLATWLRRPADYTLTAHTSAVEHPPGLLLVRQPDEGPSVSAAPDIGIEIILDTSGSMRKGIDGKRRIAIAKESMRSLFTDTLKEGVPVAIRTFGGSGKRKGAGCKTRLALPLAPLDRKAALRFVRKLEAPKKASTPIAEALAHVADDLADVEGSRIVLLITDGAESCGGDPEAAIAALTASGLEVTLNIVGFALDDEELKAQMAGWAAAGGGSYYDARDGEQLARSVEAALSTPVRVFAADGSQVGGTSVGGAALELDPGNYRVEVLAEPIVTFEAVHVPAGETIELRMPES